MHIETIFHPYVHRFSKVNTGTRPSIPTICWTTLFSRFRMKWKHLYEKPYMYHYGIMEHRVVCIPFRKVLLFSLKICPQRPLLLPFQRGSLLGMIIPSAPIARQITSTPIRSNRKVPTCVPCSTPAYLSTVFLLLTFQRVLVFPFFRWKPPVSLESSKFHRTTIIFLFHLP